MVALWQPKGKGEVFIVPDNVKVVPELRSEVNLRKFARALIALAARQMAETNKCPGSPSGDNGDVTETP